jgi:hypothetical protein
VWREKGKQGNNQTVYKLSVKRDEVFLSVDDLQPLMTTLNLAIAAELKSQVFEISVYSKPLQYPTLTDSQYSPAYAALVIFALGLLAIMVSLVRKQRFTRSKDYVALLLLSHLLLWMGNTFILTGKPSEIYCNLAAVYSLAILSLQVG